MIRLIIVYSSGSIRSDKLLGSPNGFVRED